MNEIVVRGVSIPESELEEIFETSGGPGGQHANRSQTAVRLRLRISESSLPDEMRQRLHSKLGDVVEVISADERSQARNREIARERLVSKLEAALEPTKKRKKTKPTRASRRKRLSDKRARGELKRQRRPPRHEDT